MYNNSVNLIGRLTRDAVIGGNRNTQFAHLSLAMDHHSKSNPNAADFVNVTVFGKPNYIGMLFGASGFVKKGTVVAVQGYLHSSNYLDRNGQRHFGLEVVANSFRDLQPKNRTNTQPMRPAQPANTKPDVNRRTRTNQIPF